MLVCISKVRNASQLEAVRDLPDRAGDVQS
jgi:hypothetical protein